MVKAVPFNKEWGYPQSQRVKINNVAYDFIFRWNGNGFAVLTVKRVEDEAMVFNGKLVRLNPIEAKDPATYKTLFVMLPYKVTESEAEVWLLYG